ncbi:hypothetical protein CP981_05680 [Streptomyces platensis]|uniref:Uncharacterized protein n=1 Tax=Streptomyces platensis TaxID=58346 RepID=A0AAE6NG56_STRPT|nr:hypothetical protein CP981_05680 [Streptomyces platensis]
MCHTCEPDRAMATVPAQRKVEGPPRGSCGECGCRIFLVGAALKDSLCKPCRTRQPQRQRNGPHSAKQLERQPAPAAGPARPIGDAGPGTGTRRCSMIMTQLRPAGRSRASVVQGKTPTSRWEMQVQGLPGAPFKGPFLARGRAPLR